MIRTQCPSCKAVCNAHDEAGGATVACVNCGRPFRLPPTGSATNEGQYDEVEMADDGNDASSLPPGFADRLPPEAAALGRPLFQVEKRPLPDSAFKPAFLAFVCCIPASLCIVGSNELPGKVIGVALIMGLVGFAGWWIVRQINYIRVRTTVFERGFLVRSASGMTAWSWDDVASLNLQNYDVRNLVLFIQTQRFLTTFYRLRHRNGQTLDFWSTHGPNAAKFGQMAVKETMARIRPQAQAALQAGRTFDFGPIRLEPSGLNYRCVSAPWSRLGPVDIQQGRVVFPGLGADGSAVKVNLQSIDNAPVLLAILEDKIDVQRST